ncbi:MAG: RNA polymerase sigma factor [Ilumatobacteraceae bacterium]
MSSGSAQIDEVYRSLSGSLVRLAYLLVGDREEARDIVQSVFASASRRWEAIDDPHAYLRRAVVNRANDSHRKAFRLARHPLPVARAVVHEPELDGVWHFVQSLPTAQRTVVVLRYYADLALIDIAEVTGRPASTVRSELRRALINLKGHLT